MRHRSPIDPDDLIVGIVDPRLRIAMAVEELAVLLGLPSQDLVGRPLLELVDHEPTRALLLLASRRVTHAVAVPTVVPGNHVVARLALVGSEAWLTLHRVGCPRGAAPSATGTDLVGREREIAELDRYLADSDRSILYVRGPLGIGKTALLDAFAARAAQLGCPTFRVDAQQAPPTEETIARSLTGEPLSRLKLEGLLDASRSLAFGRWVILVDNFDAWQETAGQCPLMGLPLDCRVVVAARRFPDPRAWDRAARPARVLALDVLGREDARSLAQRLGVPDDRIPEVERRAGGHPLCLHALGGAMRAGIPLDRVRLHAAYLDDVGGPDVLEPAAMPARITEEALAALLDGRCDPTELYDRLATLCIPDPSGVGLRMPHVVREAVRGRLQERNPSRFAELRRRLAAHYGALLDARTPSYVLPVVEDFFEAFEDHPFVRAVAGRRFGATPRARLASPSEAAVVEAAAERLGAGPRARTLAMRLAEGYGVTYLASHGDEVLGIVQYATIAGPAPQAGNEEGDDLELGACFEVLRRTSALVAGERALAVLGWVTADAVDGGRGFGSQSLFRHLLKVLLVDPPALALFAQQGDRPIPAAGIPGAVETRAGDRTVLVRDLRSLPPSAVLAMLIEHTEDRAPPPIGRSTPADPVATSDAVRQALSRLGQLDRLAESPLLSIQCVEARVQPGAASSARAAALDQVLREAIAALGDHGKEGKQRAVLTAVFLERAGKHEQLAVELGLPYSTFRRHLAQGIERVTASLGAGSRDPSG